MVRKSTPEPSFEEIDQIASQQAEYKAQVARWSIEIAIFLFAVLITIIILLAREVSTVVVALVAVISLVIVWLTAWIRGKTLYKRFYAEELRRLRLEFKGIVEKTVEDDLEEQVRTALRKRWEQ